MADWKQITARIRRARTSKDPAGQLAHLYEKTRDAMVAFELAKHFESVGQITDAVKWYSAAGENFRRTDWKAKVQEALVRLGAPPAPRPSLEGSPLAETLALGSGSLTPGESEIPVEQKAEALESFVAVASELQAATDPSTAPEGAGPRTGKRRRRGRRGGKNRRESAAAPGAPIAGGTAPESGEPERTPARGQETGLEEPFAGRFASKGSIPALPVEPLLDGAGPSVKGRYGDPGLSSRLTLLEMQFRRLLSCPAATLAEADRAPAGPGVFVITDTDLTTYYYVEACQTLRIAIGNLMRTGSNRRGGDSIKPRLAEHLGIPEARVSKYLADHCVVRWLQLDDGASNFAHFVVAVLRPTLND